MKAISLLVFVALVALASAAADVFTCPADYKPASACTVGPCRCAVFQTVRIQTDPQSAETEIIIRVTNVCNNSFPIYYAAFGLDSEDRKFSNKLVAPTDGTAYTGNGAYQWTTDVVDGRASATSTTPAITWLRFLANPSPNKDMSSGGTTYSFETFRFVVSNYDPVFPWYFQLHMGGGWDTFGPLDMSKCACTNCDASASVRVISPCALGYVDDDKSSNRAPSIFNENSVLYAFQIEGNQLELFYADEHSMLLGVAQIQLKNGTVRNAAVSPSAKTPRCISGSDLKMGDWNFNGRDPMANIDRNSIVTKCIEPTDPNDPNTCGRPIPPSLFVTDITPPSKSASRIGDWQMGGIAYPPQKICGQWKSGVKNITGAGDVPDTYAFGIAVPTEIYLGQDSNLNGATWNFGSGADPLPVDFLNPVQVRGASSDHDYLYGVEVAWDLDQLKLDPAATYRFQFTVHDGDQTKIGGDVGQACIIASSACPAGFTGATCQECDTNPLPRDGSWTWYCFPTGLNAADTAYELIKVPTSKITSPGGDPLYLNSGGFPIGENGKTQDGEGYFVTCDCKRLVRDCPFNCCANGLCNQAVGVCTGCGNQDQIPDENCCPTVNFTTVCFNDGAYCSGNGRCVDGTCVCNAGADGTADYEGVACNVTVQKKRKCDTIPATDCQTCLDGAAASGIYCGWCTAETVGTEASLTDPRGKCVEDQLCEAPKGAAYPNNVTNLGQCLLTTVWVPEPCPDNCTDADHGKCDVKNVTVKNDDGTTTNTTNSTCVCVGDYSGDNCGTLPIAIIVAPITAGVVAGIVIAIVAFLALAGGGAYAAAQAMGSAGAAPVVNNPLYRGDGNQGVNPLYKS